MKQVLSIGILFLLTVFSSTILIAGEHQIVDHDSLNQKRIDIVTSKLTSNEKLKKLSVLFDSTQSRMDSIVKAKYRYWLGLLYSDVGQFEVAIEYLFISLKYYEAKNYSKGVFDNYYSLSSVYYQIDDFEKAKHYALSILKDSSHKNVYSEKDISDVYNLLANLYSDQQIHDSAEFYFNEAIVKGRNSDASKYSLLAIQDNLAQLYENTDRTQQAIEKYEESLIFYLEKEYYYDITWNANRLANAYSKVGNKKEALEYLNMAKEASTKMSYLYLAHDVQKTALILYSRYQMNDSLDHSLNQFFDLSDSLVQAKITDNIQEVEARYQVEKKEAALQLSREKSARLDAEVNNQQLWLSVLLIVLAVLGGISIFTYTYYRQKKKVAELELTVKENQLDELLQAQESKAYAAMLRGQDQERERIAQDLHDRLGGTLAALKMSLRKPGNKVAEEDMEILNEAVQEVRSIAHNLSSGLMQKYGLNQAITQLKNTIEKSGGLKFQVFLHPKISILGQGVAVELYRIVQELVNNTIKHAAATEVNLQTNFDGEVFNLIYEDNGKGFDPKEVKEGIGLENIKARVKRMNGTLHIDAEKGRGAIFIVELNRGSK